MSGQPHGHQQQNKKALSPFPMPLREMFKKLVSIGKITLISQKPFCLPHLKWYEPNKTCEYHDGEIRHNIKNCHSFKEKLLQLIKAEHVTLRAKKPPRAMRRDK
jgi:hypothetical protein